MKKLSEAVSTRTALSGRHIVVTRPAEQCEHLAAALVEQGAHPVLFPVLAISALDDVSPLLDAAIRLDGIDLAVFVSPNAIAKSLEVILSRRSWPAQVRVAAIGKSSERELERFGIREVIAPQDRFDSEALLALPELQEMQGRKVLIFRGDGGRDVVFDTLQARGATVEYVTAYRRSKPKTDPSPLLKLWDDGHLDAVTLTSSEGLRNLWEMLPRLGRSWLKQTPVFVPHVRIAEQARALGLSRIELTGPADDGLVAGLLSYFSRHDA
ncbi:uroporphyrinogen-III synthase [Sulfurisoma sediminicola]|uniref:uroporphyrinogen-III synthase n=1 Tax=Sulfurisoma sediminicola TaxID=1381557 RepID=UPI001FB2C627|nr:uroporphyrinogen-III synthase [Sulfurisoma sediminicola]